MHSYDPTKQTAIFNSITLKGFAKGTFIKASRNQDTWTYQPNNSGGGARSRNPDKSGTVEFTIQQSSPTNAALSAIARRDEQTGEGVGEIMVKDRTTALSKVKGANAWIRKPADWERQDEVGNQTWIIECDDLDIFHDGGIGAT